MSDDVLAQLRRQLAEERRQLAEEQRQRKKAEAIVVEEQRRREEAEEKLQLLTLDKYLEASHSLDLLLKVATEPSTTTKGPPTNPVGRLTSSPKAYHPLGRFQDSPEVNMGSCSPFYRLLHTRHVPELEPARITQDLVQERPYKQRARSTIF